MGLSSVVIDSREPDWLKGLTFGNVPVMSMMLDTGDLIATCDDENILCIERKTAGDFLNTLRDERLFPQLTKLRELSPWAYLVICGSLQPGPGGKCIADGRESGWNWASVAGAMLTVQELGVNILPVSSDVEYEQAIIRLANRDRQQLRVKPARDAALLSSGEIILAALPGIGLEKAQALLEYCGSAAWALNHLTCDDTEKIPGIAYATKHKIRRAFGLEWDQALAVIIKETGNPVEKRKVAEEVTV